MDSRRLQRNRCISLDVVQAVKTGGYQRPPSPGDDEVQLEMVWNANAEISDFAVLRSSDNNNFSIVESGAPLSNRSR